MTSKLKTVLKSHWKVKDFRPYQEEICTALLTGQDTLALLPTGGGKSLCYQLPALFFDGPTLVISPLISLMQDQVTQANTRGIKSMALNNQQRVGQQLDNAAHGKYKLIYASPEKVQNKQMLERLDQLNLSCIAIDEAHCISQWGNDFRPAYRKLVELRSRLPHLPIIALTASATPRVLHDIKKSLLLRNVAEFKASFARSNIALKVWKGADKIGELIRLLQRSSTSSIVYCSSRKETEKISECLRDNGHEVDFFHGGLDAQSKHDRLTAWQRGKKQIMVATNAFGMGIDKEDVGLVIHMNLPANLEHYYQEIGRAGRNGQPAKAVLLYGVSDGKRAKKQYVASFPSASEISYCYKQLCNYLSIAYGEGSQQTYHLNFLDFCARYELSPAKTDSCLTLMDQASIFQRSLSTKQRAFCQIRCSQKSFQRELEMASNAYASVLSTLVRSYPGVFNQTLEVDLDRLAKKASISFSTLLTIFTHYEKMEVITFSYNQYDIQLMGLVPREKENTLRPLLNNFRQLRKTKEENLNAMIAYAENQEECKQQQLLQYFGETTKQLCRQCSSTVCLRDDQSIDLTQLAMLVHEKLKNGPLSTHQLKLSLPEYPTAAIAKVLNQMEEQHQIRRNAFDQIMGIWD